MLFTKNKHFPSVNILIYTMLRLRHGVMKMKSRFLFCDVFCFLLFLLIIKMDSKYMIIVGIHFKFPSQRQHCIRM